MQSKSSCKTPFLVHNKTTFEKEEKKWNQRIASKCKGHIHNWIVKLPHKTLVFTAFTMPNQSASSIKFVVLASKISYLWPFILFFGLP